MACSFFSCLVPSVCQMSYEGFINYFSINLYYLILFFFPFLRFKVHTVSTEFMFLNMMYGIC